MDTRKIEVFLYVAKCENFSKAAEHFSYTPSAVSHIILSLEEELSVKLFARTQRGVEITKEGRTLYDSFLKIREAERELLQEAEKLSTKKNSTLKIGAYSSIALHLLPEILQDFKKEYPDVKTTILIDDNMHDWLENGTADIILSDNCIEIPGWQPLMEDKFVAVVPENIFPGREKVSADELYEHTFLKPDEKLLDSYFDYERFKEIIPIKSIENNSVVYMVKEQIGVTVISELCVKYAPEGVRVLELEPEISRTIGVAYSKKQLSFACKQFLRYIKKHI